MLKVCFELCGDLGFSNIFNTFWNRIVLGIKIKFNCFTVTAFTDMNLELLGSLSHLSMQCIYLNCRVQCVCCILFILLKIPIFLNKLLYVFCHFDSLSPNSSYSKAVSWIERKKSLGEKDPVLGP